MQRNRAAGSSKCGSSGGSKGECSSGKSDGGCGSGKCGTGAAAAPFVINGNNTALWEVRTLCFCYRLSCCEKSLEIRFLAFSVNFVYSHLVVWQPFRDPHHDLPSLTHLLTTLVPLYTTLLFIGCGKARLSAREDSPQRARLCGLRALLPRLPLRSQAVDADRAVRTAAAGRALQAGGE